MSAVTSLALAAAVSAHAWVPASDAADQTPRLSVNARIISSDGGSGASTSSPHPMIAGEGTTSFTFASHSLCGVGGAEAHARPLEELLRQRGHVWKVTRTGVTHAQGMLTFDLDWSRYDGGSSSPAAGARHRVTLLEGATYPIDMIRAVSPNECNAAAVVLEIAADTIEEPAFADTVLQYDVWLTHTDGTGKKQSKHFVASGKQGAAADFEFALRFDVPKLVADQYDFDLVTRVLGAVKGRLRQDGKVGLELETRRMDRLERPEQARHEMPRAGGRKILELSLGETVEIELPKMSGYVGHVASAADAQNKRSGRIAASPGAAGTAPSPAVSLKDGMLIVNFKEFFAGDRFSVTVRVRKND